jgi:hypothetical protein
MTLPCRWRQGGLGAFAGRVRFRRRFGFPGRLDAFERVWLTGAGVSDRAEVRLNGRLLGSAAGAFAFEVTPLLQVRNELLVEVEGSADRGGLWGEVALEVRCSAFLEGIECRPEVQGATARLHVRGRVTGTAERPLELYLLLDGATVAYATAEAAPEGRPFHLTSEALEAGRWPPQLVRVDLVNGASLWYQWEQLFDSTRPEVPGATASPPGGRAGN